MFFILYYLLCKLVPVSLVTLTFCPLTKKKKKNFEAEFYFFAFALTNRILKSLLVIQTFMQHTKPARRGDSFGSLRT